MKRLSVPAKVAVLLAALTAAFVVLTGAAVAAGPDSWARPLLLVIGYPCP